VQANGFVANRKDEATQVEAEVMEVHEQPASATNARKAMLQSAHNFSFVRLALFFKLIIIRMKSLSATLHIK